MEQYSSFLWLGLMLVIFYFLLIRPQKKKEKDRTHDEKQSAAR